MTVGPLLSEEDGPPVEVIGGRPGTPPGIVLVCEHASNRLPVGLDLGVTQDVLDSHAAWDPGALAVARLLAGRLDAPLVAARFSRLVVDCNRPPDARDAITTQTEVHAIPGNANLSAEQRDARVREIYLPFHACLDEQLTLASRARLRPTLVTIHSFNPTWHGQPRTVQLGLLHDSDSRLADAMLPRAEAITGLRTERNQPYAPTDGVTHTLQRHALPAGLANVMIEIRNDLIAAPGSQQRVADGLADLILRAGAMISDNHPSD